MMKIFTAVVLGAVMASTSVLAAERTINLRDITTPMVPIKLLGGDREFDGNGPDIKAHTILRICQGGRAICAEVYMHAKETKSDWSETEGRWTHVVYGPLRGSARIRRIVSNAYSDVRFRSKSAGFQLIWPAEDWDRAFRKVVATVKRFDQMTSPTGRLPAGMRDACRNVAECLVKFRTGKLIFGKRNHIHVVQPRRFAQRPLGGPATSFMIVGDTGGDDISTDADPKDDTRIVAVTFRPIVVDIR